MLPPISTRIVEFLGDDLLAIDNARYYLSELRFAQMAWNYSIFPPSSPESSAINTVLLKLPAPIRTKLHARLVELSERKKRMYPDDFRIIRSIEVRDTNNKFIIRAAHYDYRKTKSKSEQLAQSGDRRGIDQVNSAPKTGNEV